MIMYILPISAQSSFGDIAMSIPHGSPFSKKDSLDTQDIE
jgi:hypothetical protein